MKKFELDHLKERIAQVVGCTNGTISTRLNRKKKSTGITLTRQIAIIRKGEATLKTDYELAEEHPYGTRQWGERLVECYDIPLTDLQKEKIAFNLRIDSRVDEIHTEIELEGKRLLDKAILGIIAVEDLPDELLKLGNMSVLADTNF